MTQEGFQNLAAVHKAAVLAALTSLRNRVLKGRQQGKAPKWLATLLFEDLEAAITKNEIPEARSRTELTALWKDLLLRSAGDRIPRAPDYKDTLWDLAYKNVDDAIPEVAERLAKATDDKDPTTQGRPKASFARAIAKFRVGEATWALQVSGPLHDDSVDRGRPNIRLLPEIVPVPPDSSNQKSVPKLAAPANKRRRTNPGVGQRFALLLFLILSALSLFAFVRAGSSLPAIPAKLEVSTADSVHFRYAGLRHENFSPVCGCKNELDPNDWWGISALARDVSMFRSGGAPYTKYVITGAVPTKIEWEPGFFKMSATVFVLREPVGGEGFDPRLLLSRRVPSGYEIVRMEDVEEAFLYIITKQPVHVKLLGKVPLVALLPRGNSEMTVKRTIGMFAAAGSRVTFTENYKPWIVPVSRRAEDGLVDDDPSYTFPIIDFVGPEVVYWTENDADVISEHKAYLHPKDGGRYITGIFVTRPPFASRVAAMPLTQAERDEDVAALNSQTKTPFVDAAGTFQVEIPNPVEQTAEYSEVYSYAKRHPVLPVDASLAFNKIMADPTDRSKRELSADLPNNYKLKDEFRYPPIPPRAGFNLFGPLSTLSVENARGSVACAVGSPLRFDSGSLIELRNIQAISHDRGILTLPSERRDTIHVSFDATGDVFSNERKLSLLPWTSSIRGLRGVYLACAATSSIIVIALMLQRMRRRRT
jgi:hypothetical protein